MKYTVDLEKKEVIIYGYSEKYKKYLDLIHRVYDGKFIIEHREFPEITLAIGSSSTSSGGYYISSPTTTEQIWSTLNNLVK